MMTKWKIYSATRFLLYSKHSQAEMNKPVCEKMVLEYEERLIKILIKRYSHRVGAFRTEAARF